MNLLSDQHVNQNPAPILDSQINTAGIRSQLVDQIDSR